MTRVAPAGQPIAGSLAAGVAPHWVPLQVVPVGQQNPFEQLIGVPPVQILPVGGGTVQPFAMHVAPGWQHVPLLQATGA